MRSFSISPIEIFATLRRNQDLIKASVKREVLGRYRGSAFGLLWSFFNPIIMLTIYTFVFGTIFKSRWGVGNSNNGEFALVLFIGLIMFNLFAECASRSPSLILGNVNYVKKVIFPLEILPAVVLLSSLFHASISLGVWLLAYFLLFAIPHLTMLYLPLIIFPFLLFILGLSWILASLGVFVRDVSQFIGILITILMFVSPVFYPASALPETYRYFVYLNPLTFAIEQARDVLYWGNSPDFLNLIIYWLVNIVFAWLGFAFFQKTRKGFADVL